MLKELTNKFRYAVPHSRLSEPGFMGPESGTGYEPGGPLWDVQAQREPVFSVCQGST